MYMYMCVCIYVYIHMYILPATNRPGLARQTPRDGGQVHCAAGGMVRPAGPHKRRSDQTAMSLSRKTGIS